MNILTAEDLSKSYGPRTLFSELSLGLEDGERIGLIGVNGSGKSTLLKIIAGMEQPDTGQVSLRNNLRVAYLAQNPELDDQQTVLDHVYNSNSAAVNLLRRYVLVAEQLEHDHDNQALFKELALLGDEMTARNAWDMERNAKTILTQLGVTQFEARVGTLSGGQRKRVALAHVLIDRADLLILDEPTNHLDPDTVTWLEGYLASTPGALLLITHDRYFLDRVVTRIVELERGKLHSFPGTYQHFVEGRLHREELAARQEETHRNAVRRELAWLRRGARARSTKQKAHVERATALVNERRAAGPGKLELEVSGRRMGKRLIDLIRVSKSLGGRALIEDFTYELARDDRLGIIGPNGFGKTTLLNLIAGRLQPDSGEVRVGETIHIAYYDQTSSQLDEGQRLIDYVTDAASVIRTPDGGTITASQMLERFLFPPEQHWSTIATLSGGERRRLYLLRTLMENPNVLLLDEPTNDLDVQTLGVLEEYLDSFPGAVIVVSHDRAFLDNAIDHLLVFDGAGKIRHYPGGYSAYRQARAAAEATLEVAARQAQAQTQAARQKESPARPRKLSFKEQRELAELERRIPELEAEQARLTDAINGGAGGDYKAFATLTQQLSALQVQIEQAFERWAELSEIAGAG